MLRSESDKLLGSYAWRNGHLSWKLWPQQLPIYEGIRALTDVETVVVLCARQFGKSHLGTLMAIEDCLRYPDRCIMIVGPTKLQTMEIVSPRLKVIAKSAPRGLIRQIKSDSKWMIGDSELVIGGFDQNSSSQRGKTVQNIYIEEVVDSRPDSYKESMQSDLGPALTHSIDGKMIFLTTLPKIPSHPFITETIPQARMSNSFYSFTIDDNAALTEKQYEACVRRAGGRESIAFRREYLNEMIRDEQTSICPPFDRTRHVKPMELPSHGIYTNVIDWGGVRDHTVGLIGVYDFDRDLVLVVDEISFPANTATDVIVAQMRALETLYRVSDRVADCPGQLSVDLQARHQWPIRIPVKADWVSGMNSMQTAFSLDKVVIDPRCRLLIETLESGQYNKQKTDFERSEALGHCDAAAAMLYMWRSIRRDSPYKHALAADQNRFVRVQAQAPLTRVTNAIQPKTFGRR